MLIERTWFIGSVRMRSPLSRTSRVIGESKMKPAGVCAGTRQRPENIMLPSKVWGSAGNERDSVPTAERRPDLAELERPALEAALEARGQQRFHARQIFRWLYRRGVADVDAMTDLSRDLRATLARDFTLTTPVLAQRETSTDG